jgi:hypothetical protein
MPLQVDLHKSARPPSWRRRLTTWSHESTFLVAILLSGIGLLAIARLTRWPTDRVVASGTGLGILALAALRPRWFWCQTVVMYLREQFGDRPVRIFYLVVGGVLLGVGLLTDWPLR